jgi:hypothetical protein
MIGRGDLRAMPRPVIGNHSRSTTMPRRLILLLALFVPVAAQAQLTLELSRITLSITASVFLNPPSGSNVVQGNNNMNTNFDGATTYNQSYTSTAVQGNGTSTVTEGFTSSTSASATSIIGALELNGSAMSWTTSNAEVPYASSNVSQIITFTATTSFTYNINLVSSGSVTNNGVTTSASRTFTFTDLATNQNFLSNFSMTNASYSDTIAAGHYRIIISESYGGPFAVDSDGSASRALTTSINLTAIPEVSTTALWSAGVVLGLAGFRKYRRLRA